MVLYLYVIVDLLNTLYILSELSKNLKDSMMQMKDLVIVHYLNTREGYYYV